MDNTPSFPNKALGLFSAYIKSLHRGYLVENLAAAAGDNLARLGYLSLFNFPSLARRPLYHSLKFSFSWLGKKMVCAENESMEFNFTEIEDDFVLVELQPEKLPTQRIPADIICQLSDGCKNFMLTVKPIDVIHLAGGTIGASAGSFTFALFIGPPGVIGMPVLLLTEVMAQGFGEYVAKISAKALLGSQANTPFSMQALQSGLLTHHPELKPIPTLLYQYDLPKISTITLNLTKVIQEEHFQKPKS
jgi:hypothetical protein